MDFFDHQERAKKSTSKLIFLFALAVAGIVLVLYLFFVWFVNHGDASGRPIQLWNPDIFLSVSLGVLLVVSLGSLYKILQLRGGGHVVAEQLGGRLLSPSSSDPIERRITNVVQEMAIAAGVPTPPVYLLDQEAGINAFAAGYSPQDAVIGITRGCAELLTRDQLQGVMAHEFSHILNGDMRLNIRLMGILHGILIIGILGYFLMRSTLFAGGRSRDDKKNSAAGLALAGFAIMIVGYVGTFFGNLIQAAVSRQREFLADASAVQFTRNPEGVAGALKAIGGYAAGSKINNPHASEASHMFFSQGLSSLFATHPPLEERIKRIDPAWDGTYPQPRRSAFQEEPRSAKTQNRSNPSSIMGFSSSMAAIGRPSQAHMDYAHNLIENMPEELRQAVADPQKAKAAVYALFIDENGVLQDTKLQYIKNKEKPENYQALLRLLPLVHSQGVQVRLPLLDMAIPALKSLDKEAYGDFIEHIEGLILADRKMQLFEWALKSILIHHLGSRFDRSKSDAIGSKEISRLASDCQILLSTLAYAGKNHLGEAQRAYAAGIATLPALKGLLLLPPTQCGPKALDAAIQNLQRLTPSAKRDFLTSCANCVGSDGSIAQSEAELLRAIADLLGCPMPPLFAN